MKMLWWGLAIATLLGTVALIGYLLVAATVVAATGVPTRGWGTVLTVVGVVGVVGAALSATFAWLGLRRRPPRSL